MPADVLDPPAVPPATASAVFAEARGFFADEEATRRWLRSPLASLGGRSPEEAAETPEGAREVLDIFVRVRHGVVG